MSVLRVLKILVETIQLPSSGLELGPLDKMKRRHYNNYLQIVSTLVSLPLSCYKAD